MPEVRVLKYLLVALRPNYGTGGSREAPTYCKASLTIRYSAFGDRTYTYTACWLSFDDRSHCNVTADAHIQLAPV
jgi:hypothetical protein